MEHSVKKRFLEQKRLRPNDLDCDLGRRISSELLQVISAVASVAFMGILTLAVAVAYLSTPSAQREQPKRWKLRVLAPQETVGMTRTR
jgi:hypothetical protein